MVWKKELLTIENIEQAKLQIYIGNLGGLILVRILRRQFSWSEVPRMLWCTSVSHVRPRRAYSFYGVHPFYTHNRGIE